MDKEKICQNCKKRNKKKQCSVSGNFVPRKKSCDNEGFEKK